MHKIYEYTFVTFQKKQKVTIFFENKSDGPGITFVTF